MAKQKKSKMALYTRQDKIILYCGYALLGLFLLAIIVIVVASILVSFGATIYPARQASRLEPVDAIRHE